MGELFRPSFLRALLEALQRQSGGQAHRLLEARLTDDLRNLLYSHVLQTQTSDVLISLDDAEDFLLGVDRALGDGSGSILERVGHDLAALEYFSAEGLLLTKGNVTECVTKMSNLLTRPFVDCRLRFDLLRTTTGFNLAIGVSGHPRATRILRHLTLGFVRAAFTFAIEGTSDRLKLFAHTVGDRCEINARYRVESEEEDITPPPSSHERPRASQRPTFVQESVAQEVERILSNAPRQESTRPSGASRFDTPIPGAARVPRFEERLKGVGKKG